MISITLEARDMYNVAKTLARSYSHTDESLVTDEDIGAAYRACCSLPYLFCPMYLIRETRALRDKEER
jgi:predicted acylesterase/phospholipase RssA